MVTVKWLLCGDNTWEHMLNLDLNLDNVNKNNCVKCLRD